MLQQQFESIRFQFEIIIFQWKHIRSRSMTRLSHSLIVWDVSPGRVDEILSTVRDFITLQPENIARKFETILVQVQPIYQINTSRNFHITNRYSSDSNNSRLYQTIALALRDVSNVNITWSSRQGSPARCEPRWPIERARPGHRVLSPSRGPPFRQGQPNKYTVRDNSS